MFKVDIYVETSIKGPGTRKGWYAAVIEYRMKNGGIHKRVDFGSGENPTYHKSVLLGLTESLKRLNTSSFVTIHTDSHYIAGCIERGSLDNWRKNGFMSARKKEIKNREEWELVDRLLKGHKVSFCLAEEHKYSSKLREGAVKRQKNVDNCVENTENFSEKEEKQNGIP